MLRGFFGFDLGVWGGSRRWWWEDDVGRVEGFCYSVGEELACFGEGEDAEGRVLGG